MEKQIIEKPEEAISLNEFTIKFPIGSLFYKGRADCGGSFIVQEDPKSEELPLQ